MAQGTCISENLSQIQINFLLMLDENKMDIFTLRELTQLAANRFDDINELVENLVHKKSLPG